MTKIHELGGRKPLPHPAYIPDLAPSEYHLSRFIAHFLCGKNFESSEAVKMGITAFFESKTRAWYRRRIINLAERLLKTIESDGLYFEEYFSFLSQNIPIIFCLKMITYETVPIW